MSEFEIIKQKLKEIEDIWNEIYDLQVRYFNPDNEKDLNDKVLDGLEFALIQSASEKSAIRVFASFKKYMNKAMEQYKDKKETIQ